MEQCTDEQRQSPPDDDWDIDQRPDRLFIATDLLFDPKSLVGSWFLSDHTRGWMGIVVGEVAPQVYLCQTYDWLVAAPYDQQLVGIDDMVGWRFFDSAKWMGTACEDVRQRWNRERAKAGESAA